MIIIKIGGGKDINWNAICENLVYLIKNGKKIIIIHGANKVRDEIAKKMGIPTKVITSPSGITSVYTDKKALEILLMAYAGLLNKQIVAKMQSYGINAVGLSGVDGRLWEAKKKKVIYSLENGKIKLINDSLTGKVEKINKNLINLLIKNNYLPVICPPAISYENEIVNTDSDIAEAIMANTLGIKQLVVLFEAPGMLKNFNDEKSLIKKIKKEELDKYIKFAVGRMKKKLLGAKKAFELGVKKIYWGDGRIKNPIFSAMKGGGTIIF